MFRITTKLLAASVLLLGGVTAVQAQDSKPLIEALIQKGILTADEAKKIQEDIKKSVPLDVQVRTKPVTRLSLSGRMQLQFDGLETDRSGTNNASSHHFFVRRARLNLSSDLGKDWSGVMEVDFINTSFSSLILQYKGWTDRVATIGLRKVNFGIEENTSSGSLKVIERSGATRYFVESNNGRRLGAGSYRTGLFLDGTHGSFFYGVALTNPERTATPGFGGTATNNNFAYWANAGVKNKFKGGDYSLGLNLGYLPDQGGKTLGTGNDLLVWAVNANINSGNFNLMAEVLGSQNDRGASATHDSASMGLWIQPSYKFSKQIEGVVRYSYVDSDGRGIDLSDAVRSAPGGGTHDKLHDFYIGGTYYVLGNDLKFQAGLVYGRSQDTITGGAAESTSFGFRSQVQLNF
ncbi:MAG: porin [Candidatus Didemnitutus sp.]|nr:porin [Candidatus Didemnitutus sp.]